MPTSYPIATLEQMAAIPAEAWPRFVAEMPDILAAVARFKVAAAAVGDMLGGEVEIGPDGLVWVDDGEGALRVSISSSGGEVLMKATGTLASGAE